MITLQPRRYARAEAAQLSTNLAEDPIFIYIWAGPHHLQYSSLPEWLQSLGMVFSVMLLAPSWGGAINFVLTLRNGWDKVRSEPLPKFFVAATTFYMMATFEGPLLSVKSVNAISHNTDWTIGHVHSGALGWNGLLIFGMTYWLVPRLYRTTLWSKKLATTHFWLATVGIALYIVSMWISGVMQGIMSNATTTDGLLAHPNYLEIVTSIIPLHAVRAVGGTMYLVGLLLLVWNIRQTVKAANGVADETVQVPMLRHADSIPVVIPEDASLMVRLQTFVENRGLQMILWAFIAVAIGGIAQIIPLLHQTPESIVIAGVAPYSPLELAGRDIYISEGCNNCHTQQVRPILGETKRYGTYSRAGEFVYDTPHLWGSKRTGPDLARIGSKYGHLWHWRHMIDPQVTSPGSVMPPYPWLARDLTEYESLPARMSALSKIGVPYTADEINGAVTSARNQAAEIAAKLRSEGEEVTADSELIALIAYLQRLGTDWTRSPENPANNNTAGGVP